MSEKDARDTRRAVRQVIQGIVRDELQAQAVDLLAIRGILMRGFWGRLRWLLTGC